MRSVIGFLGLLLGLSSALSAQQEARFSVSLSSDSILLGHYFTARFSLENSQGTDFQAPDFYDFEVLSGPNVSSSVQITNGQVRQSVSYEFYLKPRQEGLYYVAPASIQAGDQILETPPVAVKVAPNPGGIPQPSSPGKSLQPKLPDPFGDSGWNRDFFEGFSWPKWEELFIIPDPQPAPEKSPTTPPRRKTVRI